MSKKEDARIQGLCKECTHRNSCRDAKRHLNMISCSEYKHWKKKLSQRGLIEEKYNIQKVIEAITKVMSCDLCPYPCSKPHLANQYSCDKKWEDVLRNIASQQANE